MKAKLRSAFNTRQVMLSEDFEAYYYSDLHFESVGLHAHGYYELYFFVEGAVEMEIGGKARRLAAGDVIVVPPGAQHRAIVRDGAVPYRRFVVWLSQNYCAKLMADSPDYLYLFQHVAATHRYVYHFDVMEFNALRGRLFTLLDEIHSNHFGREARMALTVSDLILHLNRLVYDQTHRKAARENLSTYEAVRSYIDTHLDEDLSLDTLAGTFFLSKYYLSHLFQDTTGMSVHQYITRKRLAAAAAAIRSGTAITEACAQCGFQDYSSFYRAFKKVYGMSPRRFEEAGQAETAQFDL